MSQVKTKNTQSNNNDLGDVKEQMVSLKRVTKVVTGGKKMSFAVLMIAGNQAGMVGFDLGKANEVADAKSKASHGARRNMVRVPLREGRTIHHDVEARYGASKVIMRSAPPGTGIIAGSAMRPILELLGIQDIVCKSLGNANPHNLVRATFAALAKLNAPKVVAARRNKKLTQIIEQRRGSGNKEE